MCEQFNIGCVDNSNIDRDSFQSDFISELNNIDAEFESFEGVFYVSFNQTCIEIEHIFGKQRETLC